MTHRYGNVYDNVFGGNKKHRCDVENMLEVGIGSTNTMSWSNMDELKYIPLGPSLRVWATFFSEADYVLGADLDAGVVAGVRRAHFLRRGRWREMLEASGGAKLEASGGAKLEELADPPKILKHLEKRVNAEHEQLFLLETSEHLEQSERSFHKEERGGRGAEGGRAGRGAVVETSDVELTDDLLVAAIRDMHSTTCNKVKLC